MGVARGGHGGHGPSQSILDKSKDLGNYDKYLSLRDCFLAGLLKSGFTKDKSDTTLLFALARLRPIMAQPQWPANGQASLQLYKTNLRWHIIFTVPCIASGPKLGNAGPPPKSSFGAPLNFFLGW